jgi:hypothetical protein
MTPSASCLFLFTNLSFDASCLIVVKQRRMNKQIVMPWDERALSVKEMRDTCNIVVGYLRNQYDTGNLSIGVRFRKWIIEKCDMQSSLRIWSDG